MLDLAWFPILVAVGGYKIRFGLELELELF
jgi:hypothetical protein